MQNLQTESEIKEPVRRNPWWMALGIGALAVLAARQAPRPVPGPAGATRRPLAESGRDPAESGAPATGAQGQAAEPGRGREADKPSDIPMEGWKDILWRVYGEVSDDRVLSVAAGVTFYTLLAVFPAIAAFVSLYGLFADSATIGSQLQSMSGFLPGGALDIIGDQVKRIASNPNTSLGFGFVFGLAVALWSANAGMKAMFDALNVVYDEKEKRGFFKLNALTLSFTLGALVFLLLALGSVVVLPIVLKFVGLGWAADWALRIIRWPVLLVLIMGGLAMLYRFGPSRTKAEWRWISWGSGFSAVAWVIGSMLFSLYVTKFGSYNETYGSLGAAIGFMTWIWISATIILVGAELNAEMEHQTAKDTTVGGNKPMGARDASMADEVGAARSS